ncbi:MAG: beta-N-acetylhexosaminidase [bacterium]|nr:beta-N-acetylhexosaminidase [bacterium]
MRIGVSWKKDRTQSELRPLLRELRSAYPVYEERRDAIQLVFEQVATPGVCTVRRVGNTAHIRYHCLAQAARGVGAVLAGLARVDERTPFTTLGIMLDCSRNAVITVDHMKKWLQRLALLGYNMAMLYTEDTYALPGEPYFGFQRGRYTPDELRELDMYAARLGIELIPCIQTLGHLEKVLRHHAYWDVRDTPSVLMVGEPRTYQLIEKMIAQWKSVYRTRRIHIGMDEADDLGRGRYLTLKGYRPATQLMVEHLQRVVAICRQHGVQPMIWSDMCFRLGSPTHDYYDPHAVIPREVAQNIPPDVDLVYWDYYHREQAFYEDWIQRHRAMGKEPIMASGIWTWNRYWYDHAATVYAANPCIDACTKLQVRELVFTQWGDNGAYCDHDSAFAGMAWCAERAYGHALPSKSTLERRFAAVCRASYAVHLLASRLHSAVRDFHPDMWDDPIFETHLRTYAHDRPRVIAQIARQFAQLAARLRRHVRDRACGHVTYAFATAHAFAQRYQLFARMLAAYRLGDQRSLQLAARDIPRVRRSIRSMAAAFRTMWMRHNKPQGIECIQARFGMLDARYAELTQRVRELSQGRITRIAEWDEPCPPNI